MGDNNLSERFERAVRFTLSQEGGYSNDEADPGGETQFGITQGTLDAFRRRHRKVDMPESVRDITIKHAKLIYRAWYWDAIRAEQLPADLALFGFDVAVNCGPKRAVEMLQGALRVTQDGKVGPRTLAAARSSRDAITRFTSARLRYYQKLMERRPVLQRFIEGWRRRTLRAYFAARMEVAA